MSTKRKKITVGIYTEEFDKVKETLKLEEVTAATVRVALGLNSNAKGSSTDTQIRKGMKQLKEMDEETKNKILALLPEGKITETVKVTENAKGKPANK